MCGAAVGNYGAAVGNQAQLVGKCGPLPRAGWTETERKRPTVRGLSISGFSQSCGEVRVIYTIIAVGPLFVCVCVSVYLFVAELLQDQCSDQLHFWHKC